MFNASGEFIGPNGVPTAIQKRNIDEMMSLFPGVRYQIGGLHPQRIYDRRMAHASLCVFVPRSFLNYELKDKLVEAHKRGKIQWFSSSHCNISPSIGWICLGEGCMEFIPCDHWQ